MRTIIGLVLIIFGGNIMRIDCQDENMLDVTFEYINIEYLDKNKFIERTGENSIAWKKNATSLIHAYLGILAIDEIYRRRYICQKSRWESKIDEYFDKLVTFFFAQDKPCPILEGTTSDLTNLVLKIQRKKRDVKCGSNVGELFLLDSAYPRQALIAIALNITTSGCE